jgi:hypothetical protein
MADTIPKETPLNSVQVEALVREKQQIEES